MYEWIKTFLLNNAEVLLNDWLASLIAGGITILIIALVAVVVHLTLKRILLKKIRAWIKSKEKKEKDAIITQDQIEEEEKEPFYTLLAENKVFARLFRIIPAALVLYLIPQLPPFLITVATQAVTIVFIWLFALFVDTLINVVVLIYEKKLADNDQKSSIPGVLKMVLKTLLIVITVLGIIAVLMGAPIKVVAGVVFTSLGIFALILGKYINGAADYLYLTSSKSLLVGDGVKVGDISGTVVEVDFRGVKISRYTSGIITYVPISDFLTKGFDNFRDVFKNGRPLEGELLLYMKNPTVTDIFLKQLSKVKLVFECAHNLRKKVHEYKQIPNAATRINTCVPTIFDVYVKYVKAYLEAHEKVNHEKTVRAFLKPPTENGRILAFLAYTKDDNYDKYLDLRSEIISHLTSDDIVEIFGISFFQNPTGTDLKPTT